jgi:hypothetical protein
MPSRLEPGQILRADQGLTSPNGVFSLVMQGDGHLALFQREPSGSSLLWASGTSVPGSSACMQGDGALVVRTPDGCCCWTSDTAGHPGAYLTLQNDGNAAVVASCGHFLWASGERSAEYDLALLEHLRANHIPAREPVIAWYAHNLRASSDEGDVRCMNVVTPLRFIHAEEDPRATTPTVDNVLTIYWTDVRQVDAQTGAILWGSVTVPLNPPRTLAREHAVFIQAMVTCFRQAKDW